MNNLIFNNSYLEHRCSKCHNLYKGYLYKNYEDNICQECKKKYSKWCVYVEDCTKSVPTYFVSRESDMTIMNGNMSCVGTFSTKEEALDHQYKLEFTFQLKEQEEQEKLVEVIKALNTNRYDNMTVKELKEKFDILTQKLITINDDSIFNFDILG